MKIKILDGNLPVKITKIDIETGLYFGMKNKYFENKNIVISGLTTPEEQNIFWEISKV